MSTELHWCNSAKHNPWERFLHLVKETLAFFENPRSIQVFTSVRHWSVSGPDQCSQNRPFLFPLTSVLTSFHLRLAYPSDLYPLFFLLNSCKLVRIFLRMSGPDWGIYGSNAKEHYGISTYDYSWTDNTNSAYTQNMWHKIWKTNIISTPLRPTVVSWSCKIVILLNGLTAVSDTITPTERTLINSSSIVY